MSRQIPTEPEWIISAPGTADDFYLNLLSWSCLNTLAFTREGRTYIWNAGMDKVQVLNSDQASYVSSIKFSNDGKTLGIGLGNGAVELWNIETVQKLNLKVRGHREQVASLSWHADLLSSGCSEGNIWHHDTRDPPREPAIAPKGKFRAHNGEICALEWNKDGELLASGGNDNAVKVWDRRFPNTKSPDFKEESTMALVGHMAAVKAIAWCPWQDSLLASGGGTKDGTIKFWKFPDGELLHSLPTGSQVTSVQWALHKKEFFSTHGYPNNSIMVHAYPSLDRLAEVRNAHARRVLFSAMAPGGDIVCTGSGDEKLKFWRIWNT